MSNLSAPRFNPNAPYEVEDFSAIDPGAVAAAANPRPSNPNAPQIQIGGPQMQGPPPFDPSKPFEEEAPQGRSFGQEMARQGGLTVRHAVDGGMMLPAMIGDAANAAVNLGIRGANSAFGAKIPELGSVTDAVSGSLDRAGVPKPESGLERIVGEASKMVSSVPAFALGAGASGVRALAPLAENMGMQATSAMTGGGMYGAAKEAFPNSPTLQTVAGLAGGVAGGLRAGQASPEVARRLEDFARSGVNPTIQDVSQSSTWQRLAKILEAVPFTSDTVKAKELARLRQAEATAAGLAERTGTPGTPLRIGEQVQQGVDDYRFGKAPEGMTPKQILTSPTRSSSISAKADALYNRVPVRAEDVIDLSATSQALRESATKFDNAELNAIFSSPLVKRVAAAVENGGGKSTWNDLRNLRTELRYTRTKASTDPTIDDRILSILDDALGRDMLTGAKAVGGQRAADVVSRADRYYALSMQGLNDKLKTVFNSNRPEQVWGQIESAISAKPNKADFAKLVQLKRALPREVWDDTAATIIDNLGRPTSATALPSEMPQFSAAQFIKRYGDMSEGAKTLLFDGAGRGDLRGSLEALNRSLAQMKNTDRLANVSQSGNQMINIGTGAAAMFDLGTTLTALGLANVTARAMYNPTFVRLMTRTLRAGGPGAVQQNALQLTKFAQTNPELADDVATLMQSLVPVRAEQNPQTNKDRR